MQVPVQRPIGLSGSNVTDSPAASAVMSSSTSPAGSAAGSMSVASSAVTDALNASSAPLSPTSNTASELSVPPAVVTDALASVQAQLAAADAGLTVDQQPTTAAQPVGLVAGSADVAQQSAVSPAQIPAAATQGTADAAAAMEAQAALPPLSPASLPPGGAQSLMDALLKLQMLTAQEAETVQQEHLQSGTPLETLLLDRRMITEEEMTRALAYQNDIPFVKISETGAAPEALTQLDESVARRYKMLPYSYSKADGKLYVAMENPLDLAAIGFAEQKTGLQIVVNYAVPSELERTIAERYSQNLSNEVTEALEQTPQFAEQKQKQKDLSQLSGGIVRDAPINRIVETVLEFAVKSRASDIHIEPQLGRTRVRYRIDGILTERLILPRSVHEAVVSRIKILSNLKIDEKRVPQDGRFNYVTQDQEVDLRISTLPTIHGEKVVMRLLKKDAAAPTLEELGLNGLALQNLQRSIKVPHGIVLVTGPTGSGKTTTLYSVLHIINTAKVNIVTLEDPVEYQVGGVNQVQVNPQAGLTFASGLRSFLRQDPNIIMVGEIRDSETAELAIQASLTGHLVFSTLHTSSAAGALPRLLDMGAEPFLLASSMTLTMAQRVVRKLNEGYVEQYKPTPAVIEDIQKVLGDKFSQWCQKHNTSPDKVMLYRPKEERPVTEPEYKGRVAIFEVMPVTDEIGRMITDRKSASDIEKVAVRNGMLFMKEDGYLKALEGVTTLEEVKRVAEV